MPSTGNFIKTEKHAIKFLAKCVSWLNIKTLHASFVKPTSRD